MAQYLLFKVPDNLNVSEDMDGAMVSFVSKDGFRVVADTSEVHVIETREVKFHGENDGADGEARCDVTFPSPVTHLRKCKPLTLGHMIAVGKEAVRLLELQSQIAHFRANQQQRPRIERP